MSGLAIFVWIIVPVTLLALCGGGLWFQARANRAIQVRVRRLAALDVAAIAETGPSEEPVPEPIQSARTPIRSAGQYSGTIWSGIVGAHEKRVKISGQSRIIT